MFKNFRTKFRTVICLLIVSILAIQCFPFEVGAAVTVEAIEVEPITIAEGTTGNDVAEYNYETGEHDLVYFYYWPKDVMEYTITWSDGTTSSGVGYIVEHNGEEYSIDCKTDQSYDNQWTVGNEYTMTVSLMGVSVKVPVYIEKSPIEKMEIEPITIIEGTHGGWYSDYNVETNEYDPRYFQYWPEAVMEYTVTWRDGTTSSGTGPWVEHNGEKHYIYYDRHQSYENQWTAGNEYTMTVELIGVSVDVPVYIEKSPVENIEIEPITIVEGANGGWDSEYNDETDEYDLRYFKYWPEDLMKYTVTWSDGTTSSDVVPRVDYNGEEYSFDCKTDQSYGNQWTAGNEYTMTVSLMGVSVDVPVSIVKSPIEKIEIEPVNIIEGTNGAWFSAYNDETNEYDLEFFYYSPADLMEYTVTWSDGTTSSGVGYSVEHNGEEYRFDYETDQFYETRWTAGNEYTMTVSLMGVSVEVPVYIEKSPIEKIEIEPITIIEGTKGYWDTEYNEETGDYDLECFYYRPEELMEYTITWSDGSTSSGEGIWLDYNGEEYRFDYETDQSYENQWTAGNEYTMTVSLMGVSVEVPVSIVKPPVENIEIKPITIIEGTKGYWDTGYNEETGDYDLEYFYYWPEDVMEYTVTWSDGSTSSGEGIWLDYNGEEYRFDYETDQSYENQWTAGNEYTMTVSLMGASVDVPVYIEKSPVEKIEIKPITIIEGTNGDWDTGYNEETGDYDLEYFYYWPEDVMEYTVTWSDGSTSSGEGIWLDYNGEEYRFDYETDQSYENQWTTGNEYTMTVSLMGVSVEVPVTIIPSPVKNLQLIKAPDKTEYNVGDYFDPRGAVIRVNYTDNTYEDITLDASSASMAVRGYYVYVEYLDNYENMNIPGDYEASADTQYYTISFLNKELDIDVSVNDRVVQKVEIAEDGFDLSITVTYDDGHKETKKTLGFCAGYGGPDESGNVRQGGVLITDDSANQVVISENYYTGEFHLEWRTDEGFVTSNTLDESRWWKLHEKTSDAAYAFGLHFDDSDEYVGEVTADNIDMLIKVACRAAYLFSDEDACVEVDSYTDTYVFTADSVREAFYKMFGIIPDLTLSSMYDAETDTVTKKFIPSGGTGYKEPVETEFGDDTIKAKVQWIGGGFDQTITFDQDLHVIGYGEKRDEPDVGILGDVNGDGKINIKDATAIQKHLVSLITLDDAALSLADYNGDSKVNIQDSTAIQKMLVGLA